MQLHFAKEFTSYPYGRREEDGEFNGAAFRAILADRFAKAQARGEVLEIILDRVHGLGGSFMDEAFSKFAQELLETKGQKLTEKDLHIHGDLPHYEFYAGKIWHDINKYYEQQDNNAA